MSDLSLLSDSVAVEGQSELKEGKGRKNMTVLHWANVAHRAFTGSRCFVCASRPSGEFAKLIVR